MSLDKGNHPQLGISRQGLYHHTLGMLRETNESKFEATIFRGIVELVVSYMVVPLVVFVGLCSSHQTILNGLKPWCRRPLFLGKQP